MKYLVKFENGHRPFWLAPWDGDPGRTLVRANAEQFDTKELAEIALHETVKKYPERELEGFAEPLNVY